MANLLINKERGLYNAVHLSPETIWRTWRVVQRIQETADVVSFVVERTDERDVKPSLPGQYVTLKMTMPDGVQQPRQYSLTKADDGQHRQFAVKRVHGLPTPDGEMSSLLHNDVQVGDEVVLSAPFGDVVLEYTDRPLVMASAGIGITPMAGMLSHLVQSGSRRQVMLLHADDSEASFPLRAQVREDLAKLADGTLKTWFLTPAETAGTGEAGGTGGARETGEARETGGARETGEASGSVFSGFMDVSDVELPDDAEYYLCGPLPFLKSVRSALIAGGVPAKDIQYEVFGPDLWLADFQ
jgi:nitric oxide dioxygenase